MEEIFGILGDAIMAVLETGAATVAELSEAVGAGTDEVQNTLEELAQSDAVEMIEQGVYVIADMNTGRQSKEERKDKTKLPE